MSQPITAPPLTVSRVGSLAQQLSKADHSVFLARFHALANATCLIVALHLFLVSDAPIGVLGFVQNDTNIPRELILAGMMGLFFMDISQAVREPALSWAYLTSLSGQAVLAAITFLYTLAGDVSLIGAVTYIGPFVLSVLSVGVFAQRVRPIRFLSRLKTLLLPAISVIMTVLSFGLLFNQDAPLRQFIEDRYGLVALAVILPCLWWGAGQLRHNHIEPWKALRRCVGLYFFTLMTLYLLTYGNGVSLLGVFMTLHLSLLTVVIAFIQAREWAG